MDFFEIEASRYELLDIGACIMNYDQQGFESNTYYYDQV